MRMWAMGWLGNVTDEEQPLGFVRGLSQVHAGCLTGAILMMLIGSCGPIYAVAVDLDQAVAKPLLQLAPAQL